MRKLRILCLHGYHGNAAVLRTQMATLTDGMESFAEFVCINAPSLGKGDFGWWHAIGGGVGRGAARYSGWPDTHEALLSLFEREGPFDGVFGFSQGAALAALLVGLRSPDGKLTEAKPLTFDFALLVGGFLATDPDLARLYDSPDSYDLPSIHIIGLSDFVVPAQYSRQVAAKFKDPTVLEHNGGHVIAGTPEIRQRVASFLEERMRR